MEPIKKKTLFLSNLFQHLDGIVLIPTVLGLQKNKILNYIYKEKKCNLSELSEKHNANPAYLHVALRLLCSQGILTQKITQNDVIFTDLKLKEYFDSGIIEKYKIVNKLYSHIIKYKSIINDTKENQVSDPILFKIIENYLNIPKSNMQSIWKTHLEGAILGPIIVLLAQNNYFNNLNTLTKLTLPLNNKWQIIIKLFRYCEIINNHNKLTDYGIFILKRATSYGVTVSYLPTFRNTENLIYNNFKNFWKRKKNEEETHVDRRMNVWGSGGAHSTYFKKIDKIIIDLFNLPIEKQPKGFIDIGCGNGKLIEHIFDLIYYKTIRGKMLKTNPLFIVGSDFNYKALEATNETIKKADIWAKTAFGDISDPDSLAKRLKSKHQIELSDLLNMRSFLDHNRIYSQPKKYNLNSKSRSTGAFCQKGEKLRNVDLEQNLKEHFQKWYPYLKKYGLLIVELHTIDPVISAKNIGKTAITAYDASHGFSDQYIIEYDLFLKIAQDVGLKPDPNHEYTFPNKEIPIVSINRLINY